GVRRLRGRDQSRASDERHRAVRLGALRAGLRAANAGRPSVGPGRRKPRPPGGDLGAGRGPSGAWRRGRPPAGQADAVSAPRRRLLRPGIEDVPAYPASALTAAVRLDRNESPEELASDLRESVLAALAAARWSRYPDAHGSELKTAVATR